jgi:DNA-binding beta-propeller fold protein YncE
MSKTVGFIRVLLWMGFCALLLFSQGGRSLKLRVIVDSATVKVSPEIDGETLARISLGTILDAVEKQGEWYKVTFEKDGLRITGFIHEMLVKVLTDEEAAKEEGSSIAGGLETQAEIIQEIENRMEQGRQLIRNQSGFDQAIESLEPLIAKTFRVEDRQRQCKMAAEIYLWIGVAHAGEGDDYDALKAIRNMFEVDHTYGKEITRNMYDPKLAGLIDQAEKEYLGLITEYSLRVITEPAQAEMVVDGKEVGLTPFLYRSKSPGVSLELKKDGYKAVKDEVFLRQEKTEKKYTLEKLGKNVQIESLPHGAEVFLDGQDTGKKTDCVLPYVPFGIHKIRLGKENYAGWEDTVEVLESTGPLSISALLTGINYRSYEVWGGPDSELFQKPTGIALDGSDSIFVVCDSDTKIMKITPDGKIDSSWPPEKNDLKDLKNPSGVAVDLQGCLYVTDTKRNSVMKFDRDGKLIEKWGKEGTKDTEFRAPLDIAVDRDLNVYVADSNNHCIKKFSNLGLFERTIGRRGTSEGEFIFPAAIAINKKNEILVVDRTRLQKFSPEGKLLGSWGGSGDNEAELNNPMGIAIDQNGYVYVADTGDSRIKKFDGEGRFMTEWGETGNGQGQLNYPVGIAIDSAGRILVAERENHRIQVFGIKPESGRG